MKMQIEKINNSIKQRQLTNLSSIYPTKPKKSFVYNMTMSIMVILSFILGILIYGKHDEKANFINEKFNINISFEEINAKIGKLLNMTISFDLNNFTKSNTMKVAANSLYYQLDDFTFYNDKQVIYAFSNGVITKVNKQELRVQYDNGLVSTYLNPLNVKGYVNDRVSKGLIIGEYNDKLIIYFHSNQESLTYAQAISRF